MTDETAETAVVEPAAAISTTQTSEAEAVDPAAVSTTAQTAGSDSQDEAAPEGGIVDGTWVNPNYPSSRVRRTTQISQIDYTVPDGRPSFMRMIFGSFVMVSEEITDRASVQGEDAPQQVMQAAINQAQQQQQSLDRRPYANLRYGTIGLASSTFDRFNQGSGHLSTLTHSAADNCGQDHQPRLEQLPLRPLAQASHACRTSGRKQAGAVDSARPL